jgi:hypothetical protein
MLIYILDNNAMDINLTPLPPLPFTLRNRTHTRNTYYTIIEAEISIKSRDKLEADIITNTGTNTKDMVNSNNGGDFNPIRAEDNQINMDIDNN